MDFGGGGGGGQTTYLNDLVTLCPKIWHVEFVVVSVVDVVVVVVVYSKCASVAAHFEMKEVFDKLIITLCKFTTLMNAHEVMNVLTPSRSQGERHNLYEWYW